AFAGAKPATETSEVTMAVGRTGQFSQRSGAGRLAGRPANSFPVRPLRLACGMRGCNDPWLLVSDRDDGPRLFRRYAQRTWSEEVLKDENSSGFHWEESQVTDPAHAGRLVLLIALATYLALSLGARLIKAGLRRLLESSRQ